MAAKKLPAHLQNSHFEVSVIKTLKTHFNHDNKVIETNKIHISVDNLRLSSFSLIDIENLDELKYIADQLNKIYKQNGSKKRTKY